MRNVLYHLHEIMQVWCNDHGESLPIIALYYHRLTNLYTVTVILISCRRSIFNSYSP